jgi:hypothetical protein
MLTPPMMLAPTMIADTDLPSLRRGVAQYASLGVEPSKLVLIYAWFGQDIQCSESSSGPCQPLHPHCYGNGVGDGHVCQPGYSAIMHGLVQRSKAGLQWNTTLSLPFFDYVNLSSRCVLFGGRCD